MSGATPKPVLVVGNGIAGMTIAHALEERGVDFRMLDDGHRSSSSLAAAGLYNPLILKRLRKSWRADRFMDGLEEHYLAVEKRLKCRLIHRTGLLRRIDSIAELNEWEVRRSSDGFRHFLGEIITDSPLRDRLDTGVGLLEVPVAGWVDVSLMLKENARYQDDNSRYIPGTFDDSQVVLSEDAVQYEGQDYASIVLCRGYKEWKKSRFFPGLPFSPAKGQTMVLHVPDLDLDRPLHIGIFILPLGDDRYRIGSTYSWSDFNESPEEAERLELLQKFSARCPLPYTVEEEWAGVRPAVKDRRPLLGRSAIDPRILVFNGLGSRGIMMAPYLAYMLLSHMMDDQALDAESDTSRFP